MIETADGVALCSACSQDMEQDARESGAEQPEHEIQECRFDIDEHCFCPECRLIDDFERAKKYFARIKR